MPKQKLSKRAALAKKKRDLAAANKKAGKSLKGKDYDHKTKRFTSVKANRGNRGHGTRNE